MNTYNSFIRDGFKLDTTQHPLTSEWMNKSWCSFTMDYYSVIKKEWIINTSNNTNESQNNILSEKSQKREYIVFDSTDITL